MARLLAKNKIWLKGASSQQGSGAPIFATPAIVDGRIYLRTDKQLFAFGE